MKMALKASMRVDVMRVILKMELECVCRRLGFEEHMSQMHSENKHSLLKECIP